MNKSLLPKLLAKENVTIQHGNYKTAWFDIKNRVLGLPLWEDMHKDVYDLFVGHEVGHALETPFEGWHDSPEKLKGCPRSYINVIEDARIERKVQARYPGLVGAFNRGYEQLLKKEFFGPLTDVDWDKVKLIDKINLKTKLGSKLEVPFTPEENEFLTRSLNTSSFEEVLDLVRDILAWTKENQEELLQKPEPQAAEEETNNEQEPESPASQGHDDIEDEGEDMDDDSGQGQSEDSDSDSEEDSKETESVSLEETEDSTENETEEESSVNSAQPVHSYDNDESITDAIFREKEKTLTMGDGDTQPTFIGDVNKEAISKSVINYPKLKAERAAHNKRNEDLYEYTNKVDKIEFTQYMKSLKKNVQVAVKEFEMRKAAYQNTRATTAKTGSLDVNKLWSYKTSEDIFLQTTKLANAKNHGMMLLIDMSGSMSQSMKQVMEQTMHLVMFCKATNIPFDVYGFTSTNPDLNFDFQTKNPGVVQLDELSMPHISSSTFSKSDFIDSMEHMFSRLSHNGWGDLCKYEEWGSTPLNQAIMVSTHLIKKFKVRHGVEKMNFITFTDGDANRIQTYTPWGDENVIRSDRYSSVIQVDGRMIKTSVGSRNVTKALLDNLSKNYGVNNIGFFMADSNQDWRQRLWIMAEEKKVYSEEYKSLANKEYRLNKCFHEQNVLGYNEYYLVKGGKNLGAESDEFAVSDDASTANIRTAFKKFAKSKKQNKVLMTKFGKAVA